MSDELLSSQGLAARSISDLHLAKGSASAIGNSAADDSAALLRARQQMACTAPGAAVVRQQLQEVLWQHQAILSMPHETAAQYNS